MAKIVKKLGSRGGWGVEWIWWQNPRICGKWRKNVEFRKITWILYFSLWGNLVVNESRIWKNVDFPQYWQKTLLFEQQNENLYCKTRARYWTSQNWHFPSKLWRFSHKIYVSEDLRYNILTILHIYDQNVPKISLFGAILKVPNVDFRTFVLGWKRVVFVSN